MAPGNSNENSLNRNMDDNNNDNNNNNNNNNNVQDQNVSNVNIAQNVSNSNNVAQNANNANSANNVAQNANNANNANNVPQNANDANNVAQNANNANNVAQNANNANIAQNVNNVNNINPAPANANNNNGQPPIPLQVLISVFLQHVHVAQNEDDDAASMVAPNAPVKAAQPKARRPRRGLPRPFEPRPAARRLLFVEPLSPLPPMPRCPGRSFSQRTVSNIDNGAADRVVRRKLNFDGEEEEQTPPVGACNLVLDTPSCSLLNAPKKRRIALEDCQPSTSSASEGEVDMEQSDSDDAASNQKENECPPAPTNTPATPADQMDIADATQWARISTPASAPLPTITYDSPRTRNPRRRRSDGPVLSRKRLAFK